MRFIISFTLFIFLFACDKPEQEKVAQLPAATGTLYFGYVGGWGGSTEVFKLEGNELFRSEGERAGVSLDAEEITRRDDWQPVNNTEATEMAVSISADFSPQTFAANQQSTGCPPAAYDGVCLFIVYLNSDGEIAGWVSNADDSKAREKYFARIDALNALLHNP